MTAKTPQLVELKNYRSPEFELKSTHLDFNLQEDHTRVHSKIHVVRSAAAHAAHAPLQLNGEGLKLISVTINGSPLNSGDYSVSDTHLTIEPVPNDFMLEIETEIYPHTNLSFEGLYKTSGMFCTQCEAESFRRITYFLDRPDAMSVYTVTIEADKTKYPVLLSNGNLVARADLAANRHRVTWHDPFKKPCYLFALVAGDLGLLEDSFTTASGRNVKLQIFAKHGAQDRCRHAMHSLIQAMKWDEDTYGLEYDLDLFMIVVADDFNMGAMENKGLNVFNSRYVLADPQTATDTDYENILAVVGHEYFHNWTGNRVTCRDWFQLSLKEGLTVFRDQRFSADMGSEAVNRIDQAMHLRTIQFAEDAGPMAHPIRPRSYISIDNFYTITVYEKGAEVIRMLETLLGRDGFRRGMDLYFKRHDGQAVTTEDFVQAMADANKFDLTQFRNWYDQSGTPIIKVDSAYDANLKQFTITLEQRLDHAKSGNEAFFMPIAIGLVGPEERDLTLQPARTARTEHSVSVHGTTAILPLSQRRQSFVFENVSARPALSFLRKFSAPVKVEHAISDDDLEFLMAFDSDEFARWESAQVLTERVIRSLVNDLQSGRPLQAPARLTRALQALLDDDNVDNEFKAKMLSLPSEQYLAQYFANHSYVDVDAIHRARQHVIQSIGRDLKGTLLVVYKTLADAAAKSVAQSHDSKAIGDRALKNIVLEFIAASGEPRDLEIAFDQAEKARNMTEELGALQALNAADSEQRNRALQLFQARWKNEALVMNKWLSIQAIAPVSNSLERVRELTKSDAYDATNPNKIYSLIYAFAQFNTIGFHARSGDAYRFIADQIIEIDTRNPQVASRLMSTFNQWKTFDQQRKELMRSQIERILAQPGVSPNVFELASKALA